MTRRLRLLHAIHDFLPRHRAGSEIYAFDLARELARRHDVFVLAAEYDPATPHGTLRWRAFGGLPVVEIVNNWEFERFEETYASGRLGSQLRHALDATRPDVVHVHSLLNLTFDLPRLARQQGARSVATLHDYTLVCPSGGQRVHVEDAHVCAEIDPARCARCFPASPFGRQMAVAPALGRGPLPRAAVAAAARMPWARRLAARAPGPSVTPADVRRRLASARHVFDAIDLFVAPSSALGAEFVRLGLPAGRLEISDYGFPSAESRPEPSDGALRIGFVGTLVWHKGAHVLLEAAARLNGAFRVDVYGDPQVFPDYVAGLERQAQGLPVRFCGGFDRAALARVYGGLDVLVVPSLWPENSPLVIHEAFMHGVAVVAAAAGGIPELLGSGRCGLLYEPCSSEALAGCLQRLIDDRPLVRALAGARPAVKDITQDAREWEQRYVAVLDAA